MSFPSLATPAFQAGGRLLRGNSMRQLARGVGVFAGAGLLAAIYQIASDETRAGINGLRIRGQYKRHRHEQILMTTLGSALSSDLQDELLRSRDAWKASMKMLVDPTLTLEDIAVLRDALGRACNNGNAHRRD